MRGTKAKPLIEVLEKYPPEVRLNMWRSWNPKPKVKKLLKEIFNASPSIF